MTATQLPPAPEIHALAKKKPIFKRVWFWVLAIVAVIAIYAVAGGGGGETATSAPGTAESPVAEAPAESPVAEAPADDPLSDGGWIVSDIQVERSEFGDSFTARVTNTEGASRTGIFTLTVFGPDGTRIGDVMGSANEVEAGQAATVTFIGSSTDSLPGEPATWTYAFQNDM